MLCRQEGEEASYSFYVIFSNSKSQGVHLLVLV